MIKGKLKEKEVRKFIVIFYCVGTLGFLIPFTNPFFKTLIPYALLLNFFVLFYFHKVQKLKAEMTIFSVIFLLGLLIEILGAQTKIIFGDYVYGKGLGVKILDTPLIIGLNWLFLSYTSASIANKFKINAILQVIVASFLMLFYDLILEQVAPHLNMWSWKNGVIPLQNYLVWFILAIVFNTLIKVSKINTKNPVALIIFGCQFLFFVVLFAYFKLFT